MSEQPQTPSKHDQVNEIFIWLNALDSRLNFRLRSREESPVSRLNTKTNRCQDRIIHLYFRSPKQLNEAIRQYESEIRHDCRRDPVDLLSGVLFAAGDFRSPSTEVRRRNATSFAAGSIIPQPKFDVQLVSTKRPKTPVLIYSDDEDIFCTPPESPTKASPPDGHRKRGTHQQSQLLNMASVDMSFGSTVGTSFVSTNVNTSFGPDFAHSSKRTSFETEHTSIDNCSGGGNPNSWLLPGTKRRKPNCCHYQVRQLYGAGFFCDDPFPESLSNIPIRQVVEGTRIALEFGLPPYSLLDPDVPDNYETFYKNCADMASKTLANVPNVKWSGRAAFEAATGNFDGVALKLRLDYFTPADRGSKDELFKLSIKPLALERSDRFRRAFGWDRIACLDISAFKNAPSHLKDQWDEFSYAFKEWLDPGKPKHLFGRMWNVIHAKYFNAGKKAQKEEKETLCRVFLFASSGCNLVPIPSNPFRHTDMNYEEAVKWFLPLERLQNEPWPKTAARMELAFSSTIPTIVIRPSQVRQGKDILSNDSPESTEYNDRKFEFVHEGVQSNVVMNDGCGRISLGAIQAIVKHLNTLGQGITGLPTAFQARFNGAKGVWHRSCSNEYATADDRNIWIEISPSQQKFPFHFQDGDEVFDPLRFTFEVLKWTSDPTPSALSLAFIPILNDRGVKLETLREIVTDQIASEEAEVQVALQSPELLLQWLHKHFSIMDKRRMGAIDWNAGLPRSDVEKLAFFLQHGMCMNKYTYLGELFSRIVADYFSKLVQSMSVRMPQSTMLIGIADPFGVLEPGEVFVQFSSPMTDEHDQPITSLDGKKLIIARHPSLVPSDMQAFRAVFQPEFRDFFNVVIFSTKGQEPGAAKLQGGDYDGDTFWVCFCDRLTKHFWNAPPPRKRPGPGYFGIEQETGRVSELLGSPTSIREFLHTALKFRGDKPMLGQITKHFERLSYLKGLRDPGVEIMASLHHLLIDTTKNGYRYTQKCFEQFIAEEAFIQPKRVPCKLPYEIGMEAGIKITQGKLQLGAKAPDSLDNVVDVIFFGVIMPQLQNTWARLDTQINNTSCKDPIFQQFVEKVTKPTTPAIDSAMKDLYEEINRILGTWNHKMSKNNSKICAETIEHCYKCFQAYQPLHANQPEIGTWLTSRLKGEPCTWSLLKAAKMYELIHTKKRTNIMFHLAGRQLAYLKAMNFEDTQLVVAPIRAVLKPGRVKGTVPQGPVDLLAPPQMLDASSEERLRIVDENFTESIDDDDFYSTCAFMYDDDDDDDDYDSD